MKRTDVYIFVYLFCVLPLNCLTLRNHDDKTIWKVRYREHGIAKRSTADNSTELPDVTTEEANTNPTLPQQQPTTAQNHPSIAQPQTTAAQPQLTTAQPQATTAQPQATTAHPEATTAQPANTTTITDHHTYYTSKIFSDPNGHFWNELQGHTQHELSHDRHMVYSFVSMSFKFPFYGHMIDRFAVTPLGFLYISSFTHPNLDYAYTHYIAPLMANFDTTGNYSEILYKDDGSSFVIEWRNVELHDQEQHGNYTFQTTLFKNGTIMFVYKTIPETNISQDAWPVKIGLSDAFYYDIRSFFGFIRYVFKYHEVAFNVTDIEDNMVIILNPVPTCNLASTCEECTTIQTDFNCKWCHAASRCSDGLDWHRQEWIWGSCSKTGVTDGNKCNISTNKPVSGTTTTAKPGIILTSDDEDKAMSSKAKQREGAKKTAMIVVPMVAAVALIIVFVVVFFIYARTHPTSKPGQWIIKHRPSQWKENFSNVSFTKDSKGDKIRIEEFTDTADA